MQDSIHIVNYIKAKSLNSRLFEKLCVNMNGIFDILFCCEMVISLQNSGEIRLCAKGKGILIQKHNLVEKLVGRNCLSHIFPIFSAELIFSRIKCNPGRRI